MNTAMTWASIIMAGLTLVAIVGLVSEQARARRTHPAGRDGSGIGFTDGLLIAGFVVPILLGGLQAIASL